MSAIPQNMIAAPAALRTTAVHSGRSFIRSRKFKPAQWINWTLDGPLTVDTTYRAAGESLSEFAAIDQSDRVLHITAGHAGEGNPGTEQIPFRTAAFDVVMSEFGAMYAADDLRMAGELLRVCRPGGRIGLTAWTPDGFDGRVIETIRRYLPTADHQPEPSRWGTRKYLDLLFGHSADALGVTERSHTWSYSSPAAWLASVTAPEGRFGEAFRMIDPDWRVQLEKELLVIVDEFNADEDGSMIVHSNYLEFVAHKSTWRA